MYKFYNANSHNNFVNDCTVRAISKAEQKTWDETYEKLSNLAQEAGTLFDDVNFVEKYLDTYYPIRICQHGKSVRKFLDEHPKGTYLITMRGHITVIVDGVLYDTFDCRDRQMLCSWKVK